MYKQTNKQTNKLFIILLLAPFFVFCISPLIVLNYNFQGHDSLFHLGRIVFTEEGLKNFHIRQYISCFKDYVYADSILYPKLFIYIPAFLNIFINNIFISANILKFVIILLNFIVSYKSIYYISKVRFTSIVFTLIYNVNYYFLFNVYDRDAVGETLGLVFLPMVIASLYKIYFIDCDKLKPNFYLIFGLSFILQSHILTFYYTLIIIILYCLLFIDKTIKKNIFLSLFISGLIFLLINVGFLIPFLDYYLDKKLFFTQLKLIDYISTFLNLFGAIEVRGWYLTANHFGREHIVIYILNLIMLIFMHFKFKDDNNYSKVNKSIYSIAVISFVVFNMYLLLCFENPILDTLLKNDLFFNIYSKQRMSLRIIGRSLTFLSLSFAIISNLIINLFSDKYKKIISISFVVFLGFILIMANKSYIQSKITSREVEDDTKFDMELFKIYNDYEIEDEYVGDTLYRDMETNSDEQYPNIKKSNKNIHINNCDIEYLKIKLNYEIEKYKEDKEYFIDLPYFNYKYFVVKNKNDKFLKTYYSNDKNRIRVKLNNDKDELICYFNPPLIWHLSNIISLISLVLILIFFVREKCRKT